MKRGEFQADLARHRYMKTDPDNRLVADKLEAEWNEKLRIEIRGERIHARRAVLRKQPIRRSETGLTVPVASG